MFSTEFTSEKHVAKIRHLHGSRMTPMLLSDTLAPKSQRVASDKAKENYKLAQVIELGKRTSDSIQISVAASSNPRKSLACTKFPSINSSPSQNAKK
jgi:hypothetical protein